MFTSKYRQDIKGRANGVAHLHTNTYVCAQLLISGRRSSCQEVTALITLSSTFKNIPNCSLDSSISKVNILYKV